MSKSSPRIATQKTNKEKTMKTDTIHIYFELDAQNFVDENNYLEIYTIYNKAFEKLKKTLHLDNKIYNEGHTLEGSLLCYFIIEVANIPYIICRLLLNKTFRKTGKLSVGDCEAFNFTILEHPGMTQPIELEHWLEYYDENT